MKKTHETIIIGAGMAGLGCARTLHKKKKAFLIITEDIGGRIMTTKDNKINLGALFVLKSYKNVLRIVKKTQKASPLGIRFHKKGKRYSIIAALKYPLQLVKFIWQIKKFRRNYFKYKKNVPKMGQKKAILHDPYLKKLYKIKASQWIKEKGISKLTTFFFDEVIYACTFLPPTELSAFDYLHLMVGFTTPAYEFQFPKEQVTKRYEKQIVIDTVVSIVGKSPYTLKTTSGKTYQTKNLVVATPPHISKELLHIKKMKKPVEAYVTLLKGRPKKSLNRGEYEVFSSGSRACLIVKEPKNSYLYVSPYPKSSWKKYFESATVIKKQSWTPAFNMKGDTLISPNHGKNLYLAGDYNIDGLEEAYLTGIYAANQIIKNSK